MCGGFSCSKNALIALNILYIVSIYSFIKKKVLAINCIAYLSMPY